MLDQHLLLIKLTPQGFISSHKTTPHHPHIPRASHIITNLGGKQVLGANHVHAARLQLGMQHQLALARRLQPVEHQVHLVLVLLLRCGRVQQNAHNVKHSLHTPDQPPAALKVQLLPILDGMQHLNTTGTINSPTPDSCCSTGPEAPTPYSLL